MSYKKPIKSGPCQKCSTYRVSLERDHIIPRWKFKHGLVTGDPEVETNIQWLCANCHKDKSAKDLLGFKHSNETRQRLKETWTDERREATSQRMTTNNPAFGKPSTNRGKSMSLITRAKLSLAHLGKPNPRMLEVWEERRRYSDPKLTFLDLQRLDVDTDEFIWQLDEIECGVHYG